MNFGYEHRTDTVTFSPDAAELSGALAGFSGATVPINEGYGINEAFFEVRAPLAHDLPGVQDLTVDTGYRYSDYNTTGQTNTYKFEVQYAPIEDVRARFSFDRAVRAPNLIELFVAPSYGQENVVGSTIPARARHPRRRRRRAATYRRVGGAIRLGTPVRRRPVRPGDRGKQRAQA